MQREIGAQRQTSCEVVTIATFLAIRTARINLLLTFMGWDHIFFDFVIVMFYAKVHSARAK